MILTSLVWLKTRTLITSCRRLGITIIYLVLMNLQILKSFPYNKWSFVIEYFVEDPVKLFEVAENKYGCRVVQLSLECLSAAAVSTHLSILSLFV